MEMLPDILTDDIFKVAGSRWMKLNIVRRGTFCLVKLKPPRSGLIHLNLVGFDSILFQL